jgi:hypothetical protein
MGDHVDFPRSYLVLTALGQWLLFPLGIVIHRNPGMPKWGAYLLIACNSAFIGAGATVAWDCLSISIRRARGYR